MPMRWHMPGRVCLFLGHTRLSLKADTFAVIESGIAPMMPEQAYTANGALQRTDSRMEGSEDNTYVVHR
jgi:hypothetical protein